MCLLLIVMLACVHRQEVYPFGMLILSLSQLYYEAGADFSETNTFSGTWIAQADYAMEAQVIELFIYPFSCQR